MRQALLPALALGALSTGALAEPMTLTSAQMDAVTAGQFFQTAELFVNKDIDVDVDKDFDIDADVFTNVDLFGSLADAEAFAFADGNNTFAETLTFTYSDAFTSAAFSGSISATDFAD